MRWQTLIRFGLLLLLVGLIGPVVIESARLAEGDDTDAIRGWVLQTSGLLLGGALVLWILEKTGLKVSGARCVDCRKRIQYGHAYCYDHLMARTNAAREKYHGERGMGI